MLKHFPSFGDVIFLFFKRFYQSLYATSKDYIKNSLLNSKGGGEFNNIQHRQSSTASRSNIKHATTVLKLRRDSLYQPVELRQSFFYGCCNCFIFTVKNSGNFFNRHLFKVSVF